MSFERFGAALRFTAHATRDVRTPGPLARRFRALAPALASPFASSARATVAEVSVPFTVVGLDGARHRCVGREGHSLVKGMQQAKLPLALMGVNGYDAALRLPREWHDKVPEMDLAQVRPQRPVHFPQWRECAASACAPPPERAPQRPYLKAQQRESAPPQRDSGAPRAFPLWVLDAAYERRRVDVESAERRQGCEGHAGCHTAKKDQPSGID